MPWGDLFRGIRKIGYQGAIVMEPFVMTGGQVGRNISVFRDLRYGMDLDAEARRACRFVKRHLAR
jgi:D-psicose/D-tagatose/L-ribulose 3-epimerase